MPTGKKASRSSGEGRTTSNDEAPAEHASIYRHSKRQEWGYCAVVGTSEDRTTFKFDDGSSRTILNDHIAMMERMEGNKSAAAEALGISRSRLYRLLEGTDEDVAE